MDERPKAKRYERFTMPVQPDPYGTARPDPLSGLTAEVIAQRCGVDVSTARRWKSGATRVPKSAEMILNADLGCFSKPARGWRINGEELVSPEGWRIGLNEVLSWPLQQQALSALRAENRELRAQLEFKAANEPELDLIEVRA